LRLTSSGREIAAAHVNQLQLIRGLVDVSNNPHFFRNRDHVRTAVQRLAVEMTHRYLAQAYINGEQIDVREAVEPIAGLFDSMTELVLLPLLRQGAVDMVRAILAHLDTHKCSALTMQLLHKDRKLGLDAMNWVWQDRNDVSGVLNIHAFTVDLAREPEVHALIPVQSVMAAPEYHYVARALKVDLAALAVAGPGLTHTWALAQEFFGSFADFEALLSTLEQ
jgi:hypothetical protein